MAKVYDLAIIGGGINGCGIAREAAGHGCSVFLCEQNDLASGTSSASTKLIHGGLRYLEHREFRLVRESLRERELLWAMAPHIIHPLRFVLPRLPGLRPGWLLRLGLFLYDNLGGRNLLPGTRSLDLRQDEAGRPLKPTITSAFEYSDCWVDDARLVVLNALDAARLGADIRTRTTFLRAERDGNVWRLTIRNNSNGEQTIIQAHALVNAGGPWVARLLNGPIPASARTSIRMVQGSHIIVRKLYDHDRCYIFQNADGRIVFAIPYEDDFTMIGTTDRDYHGDPADVHATEEEIVYLCGLANDYFNQQISPADVVRSFAGVRPLHDDGATAAQAATRDYLLTLDSPGPPLLNVFGGKITTYRRLANAAMEKLAPYLPPAARPVETAAWTSRLPLPGGDFPVDGLPTLIQTVRKRYPFLNADHARRLARAYGTRAIDRVLGDARDAADLGQDFGATLTEAEVRYAMDQEWARTAADMVWRRSKLGLRMTPQQIATLDHWMQSQRPATPHQTGIDRPGQPDDDRGGAGDVTQA